MKKIDKVIYLLGCLSFVAVVFLAREISILVLPSDAASTYVQPEPVVPDKSHCIENKHYIYCTPTE